jgi:cytochrome c
MDFNKGAAGFLLAGVIFVGTLSLSEGIFAPDKLKKQAYVIDTGVVQTADTTSESKPTYLMGDAFAALVDKADATKGEATFKKCTACHSNNQGGANKIGPNLWLVFEKDIASHEGYKYSTALAGLDGKWTTDHLNGWLYNPREYAKGNRMGFAGIKDDLERANVIAYLKTLR